MAVAATGFFDGVHLGHRKVIDTLVSLAHERGEESIVITFWPHPRTVFQDGARELRLLTSLDEKKALLHELGVDRVEVLDFTRSFGSMTAREYLRDVVRDHFGATAVVIGYDNRLGSDRLWRGELTAEAASLGLEAFLVEPCMVGDNADVAVSSTKIRTAIEAGDMEAATKMLGRPYHLHGVVVAGNRLGRTIGFPTANIRLYDPLKCIPDNGVYAVEVQVLGNTYKGMCNIGVRPTVATGASRSIETNILDFDHEIYGHDLHLSFVAKMRDERRFDTLADLQAQLAHDRDEVRRII